MVTLDDDLSGGRLPTHRPASRTRRIQLGGVLAVLAIVLGLASPALAGSTRQGGGDDEAPAVDPDAPVVDVIEVDGLLDPVLVDFIEQSIGDAEAAGDIALVLQMNSPGSVVSDEDLADLARAVSDATVPVAAWIGPSGSQATGGAAEIVGVADVVGMAPGTRLGDIGEQRLPVDEFGVLFGDAADRLADGTVGADEAQELGIVAGPAPTVLEFFVQLDGVETRVVGEGEAQRREPVTTVRFGQLPLASQLMHTVASPPVAYLLFIAGMAILIFELFVAGVGVAGVVGAGCLILGSYGLAVLPTNWYGVALLVFAMFAFAIDVQTGVPRVWTGIGMAAFVVGSLTLYGDGVTLSWITLVVGVVAMGLTFLAGMPSMVRTRFSTPTIGREWMIGEMGRAVTTVDPNGTVQIRDALWRATTNRATPIAELDAVRVIGIDGLVLEVEPEVGAARDYRDRSPRS